MANPSKAKTGRTSRPVMDRIWPRIKVSQTGCWEWTGALRSGYGVVGIGSRSDGTRRAARAHRVVWEELRAEIPEGLFLCHHCDNPKCCNPDHMFLGTAAENTADMDRKGRRVNTPNSGVLNGRARLDPEMVELIRSAYQSGVSQSALSRALGFSRSSIGEVVRGERWAA